MKLKKANAIIGLMIILSLCGHAGTMGCSLWTGWFNYVICKMLAHITASLVSVHVVLTLVEFFFFHDGSTFKYKGSNWVTILQRVTAVAMVLLLHVHMKAYAHMATGEVLSASQELFFSIEELLFFGSALSHAAISFSKGLITLGLVSTSQAVAKIDRISYVIGACAMLIVAGGMLSFFLF